MRRRQRLPQTAARETRRVALAARATPRTMAGGALSARGRQTPRRQTPTAVQAELREIADGLFELDQRLGEVAVAIGDDVPVDGILSTQLRCGVEILRRDLLSDAVVSLRGLAELDEEAAVRRYLETVDLLDRLAAIGSDADRLLLDSPEAVAQYLLLRYSEPDQEILGAVYLDSNDRFLGIEEVCRGSLWGLRVEPRTILRRGLERVAVQVILWHTHPGGNPEPSIEDKEFTQWFSKAANVLGMELRDHLILGHGGRWSSMKCEGGWK